MIQWAIPHTLEGATSRSYSSKQTFATSFRSSSSDAYEAFGGSYTHTYDSFSVSSYTTIQTASSDTDGQWSYYTESAMQYTASYLTGYTYVNTDNSLPPLTTRQVETESSSVSSSASASDRTTFALPTFSGGTSTVETTEATRSTTTAQSTETTAWTTVSSDSRVSFATTTASASEIVTTSTTYAQSQTTVTEGGETFALDRTALVLQADNSEVIYSINSPDTSWNGFTPASDAGQSATRATVFAKYSTTSMLSVASSAAASTLTVSHVTTSINVGYTTSAASTVTAVNYFYFPNTTTTQASSVLTTSETSLSGTLFYSAELVYGYGIGQPLGQSAAVTTVTMASHVSSVTTCASVVGTLSIATTCATTASSVRTTTQAGVRAPEQTSSSLAEYGQSETAALTWAEQGITQVSGPAMVTVASPGMTSKEFYSTRGAVLDGQAGLWFTANGSGSLQFADAFLYATAGESVPGKTLLPQTNNSRTVDGSSIYYTTSTTAASDSANTATSAKTTLSLVASVAGNAQTFRADRSKSVRALGGNTLYSPNANGLGHFGGGPLAPGQTVVQAASGLLKDRINGDTISYIGGATSYGPGWSSALRRWEPIAYIAAPENRLDRGPIVWTERRNIDDAAAYFTSLTG